MLQHYQLLKPRLNLGPSTTAHVHYAKYLLRILVLLKSLMESTLVHIAFFLNGEKNLKENLEHLDFLRSWTYNLHKKRHNCKYDEF